MEKASNLTNIKSVIRAILISYPNAVTIRQLVEDYREYEGKNISYRDFGFENLYSFLKSIDDTVMFKGHGQYATITGVATAASRHIEIMVSKQRVQPGCRRKPRYGANGTSYQNQGTYFENRTNNISNSWLGWRQRREEDWKLQRKSKSKVSAQPKNQAKPKNYSSSTWRSESGNSPDSKENRPKEVEQQSTQPLSKEAQPHPPKDSTNVSSCDSKENRNSTEESVNDPPKPVTTSQSTFGTNDHTQSKKVSKFEEALAKLAAAESSNEEQTQPAPVSVLSLLRGKYVPAENYRELQSQKPQGGLRPPNPAPPRIHRQVVCQDLKKTVKFNETVPKPSQTAPNIEDRKGKFRGYEKRHRNNPFASSTGSSSLCSDDSPSKRSDLTSSYFHPNYEHKRIDDLAEALPSLLAGDPICMVGMPYNVVKYGQSIPNAVIPNFVNLTVDQRIFVADVYSPHRFWFHWYDSCDILDTLMNDLNLCYNTMQGELKIGECNIVAGQVCAAKFMGQWHRAEILDGLNMSNEVKVIYIDYGTVRSVPLKDIKFLLEQFAERPKQAFRGTLDSILPQFLTKRDYLRCSWNRDATRLFLAHAENMVYSKIVYIDYDDQIFYMTVTDTTTFVEMDIKINDSLIYKGLAVFDYVMYRNAPNPHEHYKKHYKNVEPTFEKLEKGKRPSFAEIGECTARGFDIENMMMENETPPAANSDGNYIMLVADNKLNDAYNYPQNIQVSLNNLDIPNTRNYDYANMSYNINNITSDSDNENKIINFDQYRAEPFNYFPPLDGDNENKINNFDQYRAVPYNIPPMQVPPTLPDLSHQMNIFFNALGMFAQSYKP